MTEIHPLIRQRRSSRLYDPDRPVSPEQIAALLEAARWAPSGGNGQPWRYLVFDDRVPEARAQARACLNEDNQAWANAAPVLIAGISRDVRENGRANAKAQHDLGLANMSLLLQAIALGLNCRPMGGFDAQRLRQQFHIPEDHTPTVMIAVGYPGRVEDVPESIRAKEDQPRERLPIEALVHWGSWSQSAP
jgi:nitroreductase